MSNNCQQFSFEFIKRGFISGAATSCQVRQSRYFSASRHKSTCRQLEQYRNDDHPCKNGI
ncbi:MAG: hypothetical protein WCD00_09130 [Desulfuromonadaceae bacterium]